MIFREEEASIMKVLMMINTCIVRNLPKRLESVSTTDLQLTHSA
jgi:hypothetical protein